MGTTIELGSLLTCMEVYAKQETRTKDARIAELEAVLREIHRTTTVVVVSHPVIIDHIKSLATNALNEK